MNGTTLTPRAHRILTNVEAWAHQGPVRAVVVKVGVSVFGPLVIATGIAMLVLPGPGLVVMALGAALLALEYDWARRVLGLCGQNAPQGAAGGDPEGRIDGTPRLRCGHDGCPSHRDDRDHGGVHDLCRCGARLTSGCHTGAEPSNACPATGSARVGLTGISGTVWHRLPCSLPGPPPAPARCHHDGPGQRPDDAARPQVKAITGQQADREPADQRADESGHDRQCPVDAGVRSAEDQLGTCADEHAEQDDAEDEHAQRIATKGPVGRRSPRPLTAAMCRLVSHRVPAGAS